MTQIDRLIYDLKQMGIGGEYLDDLEYMKTLRSDLGMPDQPESHTIQQKDMGSNEEFSLFRTLLAGPVLGFIEGFTTLPVGLEPRNSFEEVSSSLGHVLGFMGVIPGVGTAASIATKATAGSVRALAGTARLTGVTAKSSRLLKSANKMDKWGIGATKYLSKEKGVLSKSFPMRGADFLMKRAAFQSAAGSASKFLGTSTAAMATKAVAKSAIHLGTASALSNIWHGKEAMMEAAIHGAVAGGLFKGMAHVPGMRGQGTLDQILRGTVGATMMTAPVLAQGDPDIPILVYNAVLGAYFGAKEMPWYRQRALEYVQDQHAIHKVKPYTISQNVNTNKWLKTFGESRPKVEKALNEITNELGSVKTAPNVLKAVGKWLGKSDHEKLRNTDIKGLTEAEKFESAIQDTEGILKMYKSKEKEYSILADGETNQVEKNKIIKARIMVSEIVEKAVKDKERLTKLYDEAIVEQGRKSHITEENFDSFEEKLHSLNKQEWEKPKDRAKVVEEYGNDIIRFSQTHPDSFNSINEALLKQSIKENDFAYDVQKYTETNAAKIYKETPTEPDANIADTIDIGNFDKSIYDNNLDIPIFGEPAPLKDLVKFIAKSNKWGRTEMDDQIKILSDHMENAIRPFKTKGIVDLTKKDRIWGTFRDSVEEAYGRMEGIDQKEFNFKLNNDLKRSFNHSIQQVPIREISYDVDTKEFIPNYTVDVQGNPVKTKLPEGIMHNTIYRYNLIDPGKDPVVQLTTVRKAMGEHRQSKNVGLIEGELSSSDLTDITKRMYREGYYPYGGRDATEVIKYVPLATGKGDVHTQNKKNFIEAVEASSMDGDSKLFHEIARFGAKKLNMEPNEIEHMIMSNANYWALKNSEFQAGEMPIIPVESYKKFMQKGFISDLLNFNKRSQPIWSSMPKVDPAGNMEFKSMLVEDYAKQLSELTGMPEKYFEPLSDGGVTMAEEPFVAMAETVGVDPKAGFAQVWIMKHDPVHGLFMTKAAVHRAGPEMSAEMKRLKIDQLIPQTAAKQSGTRPAVRETFKDGVLDVGKGETFIVKGNEMSIELNRVYDSPRANLKEPSKLLRNILTNHVEELVSAGELRDAQDFLGSFVTGKGRVNDKFHEYMHLEKKNTKEAQDILSTISVDELSLEMIGKGLKMQDRAFEEKFWAHAVNKFNPEVRYKSDLTTAEELAIHEENLKDASDLDRVLPVSHLPAARLHKFPSSMYNKVYQNYFLNRATKPLMENSGHGVLRKFDSQLQHRIGKEFDLGKPEGWDSLNNLYFLDDGWKKWKGWASSKEKRRWGLETLEDALTARMNATGRKKDFLNRKLEAIVARVPIAEFSGSQVLNFGGFTGTQGSGIMIAPKNMERLSGADLDIDGAYFFMAPENPKWDGFTKPLKRQRAQQDTMADRKDLFIRKDKEMKYQDNYLGMFEPWHRMKMGHTVSLGRGQLIQEAQRSKVLINNMMTEAIKGNGELSETSSDGMKIVFKTKDNGERFRETAKSAVETAVDAGKYGGTVKPNEAQALILEAAFPEITVNGKKVVDYVDFVDKQLDNTSYKARKETRQALFGKLSNSTAEKVLSTLKNHPKNDNSMLGYMAKMMKDVPDPPTMLSEIFTNSITGDVKSTDFYKVFDSINKFIKQANKGEFGDNITGFAQAIPILTNKRFVKVPTETLIRKMQAAKEYGIESKSNREDIASDNQKWNSLVAGLMPEAKDQHARISAKNNDPYKRERWIENKFQDLNAMVSNNISDVVGLKTVLNHALNNDIPVGILRDYAMKASDIRSHYAAQQSMLRNRNGLVKILNQLPGTEITTEIIARRARRKDETHPEVTRRVNGFLHDLSNQNLIRRQGENVYEKLKDVPKISVSLTSKNRAKQMVNDFRMQIGGNKMLQDHFDFHLLSTFKLSPHTKSGKTSTSRIGHLFSSVDNLGKYLKEYNDFFNDVKTGEDMNLRLQSWESGMKKVDAEILAEKTDLEVIKDTLIRIPGLGEEYSDIGKVSGKLDARGTKLYEEFTAELQNYRDRVGDQAWMTEDGITGMIKGFSRAARPQDITPEDVKGFISRMKYWRKGFGVIDWISNLRKGKEGQVRWKSWFQFAEKAADDQYLRDMYLVAKKNEVMDMVDPLTGDVQKVYGDMWVPMNHMHRLIHHTNNALDLGAAASERFQHMLRDDDKLGFIDTVETIEGSRTLNESVFSQATAITELKGAKNYRDKMKAEGENLDYAQSQVDRMELRLEDVIKNTDVAEDQQFVYTQGKDQRTTISRNDLAEKLAVGIEATKKALYKQVVSLNEGGYADRNIVYKPKNKFGSIDVDVNKTWENILGPILESNVLREPLRLDPMRLLTNEYNANEYAKKNVEEYISERSKGNLKKEFIQDLREQVPNDGIYSDLINISKSKDKKMSWYLRTLEDMYTFRDNPAKLKEIRDKAVYEAAKAVKRFDALGASMKSESTVEFFENSLASTRNFVHKYGVESKLDLKNKNEVMDFLRARTKLNNRDYFLNDKAEIQFRETEQRDGYWMHTDYEPGALNAAMYKELQKLESGANSRGLSEQDLGKRKEAIWSYFRGLRAKDIAPDMMSNVQEATLLTQKEGISRLQAENNQLEMQTAINTKPGAAHKRTMDIDGYSRKFNVMEKYIRTMNKAIYTKAGGLLSRRTIDSFIEGNSMGKQTQNWATYQKMYARDVLGYPSMIPEHIYSAEKGRPLHDPLNLKYTPYRVMSDQNVLTPGTKLNKVFNMIHKVRSRVSKLEKKAYEKEHGKPMSQELIDKANEKRYEDFQPEDLAAMSNLEAKYEMASLLAHSKTGINNILGGTANTWIWSGTKHLWNANKMDQLKKINTDWKTRDDVDRTLSEWGVVEEMMTNELNLRKEFTIPKYKRFAQDVVDYLKRDPGMDDTTLMKIAKDNNITEDFMNKAGWFMRKSERYLRSNAFLASYMQAREQLIPVTLPFDSNYLIEKGKAGVKATQFLYSASMRPAFARTSVGKIFSRLKLWGWNSVKFRREVYQSAKFAGMNPNTVEHDRYRRMATADAMMVGLATLMPFTMFDYGLPGPYSYMQATGQWLFAEDDEQRSRAFYGELPAAIAPLSEFVPVILRAPVNLFGAMFTSDNWLQTSHYYLWASFPFGRIGKDMWKSMQNPILTPEYMTGMPFSRLQGFRKKYGKFPNYGTFTPQIEEEDEE